MVQYANEEYRRAKQRQANSAGVTAKQLSPEQNETDLMSMTSFAASKPAHSN
jgi:hypothetical protein